MRDPTADEMREFLKAQGCEDAFDREEAIYWFASNWHGGQSSNLYSALSTSEFNPGPLERSPEDQYWYEALEAEYVSSSERDPD